MPTNRLLFIAGLASVVVATAAVGGVSYYNQRTGNIYHPHARFVQEAPPPLPKKPIARFAWPVYGYTANHTRDFANAAPTLRPPFYKVWVHGGSALLEFPPVIYGNSIFQLADDGTLRSIDKANGNVIWQRRLGTLSASAPAVGDNSVFITLLSGPGNGSGRVVALNATTGRIRWSRDLPAPSESSPLLDGGRIYFGSQNGTVYALSTQNGSVQWAYHASGAVKCSPTLAYGNLYFGDYSGNVQAVRESDGHLVWRTGSGGTLFGSGQFYSTPAVIYGRVFLGNTDGRIYAYDAYSGHLDWAVQTGAYVYSSPAVADAPGLGPTVYSGSYDGHFYAIDAQSGTTRWTYDAGGRISGSATVVGHVVYFADLGTHSTTGLGISTGRVVISGLPGSFDPVVTDGDKIYLTGTTGIYALKPRNTTATAAQAPARKPPLQTCTQAALDTLANGAASGCAAVAGP